MIIGHAIVAVTMFDMHEESMLLPSRALFTRRDRSVLVYKADRGLLP